MNTKDSKKQPEKKLTLLNVKEEVKDEVKEQRAHSLHARVTTPEKSPGKVALRYGVIVGALLAGSALTAFALYVFTKPEQAREIILPSVTVEEAGSLTGSAYSTQADQAPEGSQEADPERFQDEESALDKSNEELQTNQAVSEDPAEDDESLNARQNAQEQPTVNTDDQKVETQTDSSQAADEKTQEPRRILF